MPHATPKTGMDYTLIFAPKIVAWNVSAGMVFNIPADVEIISMPMGFHASKNFFHETKSKIFFLLGRVTLHAKRLEAQNELMVFCWTTCLKNYLHALQTLSS